MLQGLLVIGPLLARGFRAEWDGAQPYHTHSKRSLKHREISGIDELLCFLGIRRRIVEGIDGQGNFGYCTGSILGLAYWMLHIEAKK